jgi:ABC-type sugar transport system ATPase subunit
MPRCWNCRHLQELSRRARADNVSLSLYPGEVTALIGENGAGKSTLVKILTGIYQPDAGRSASTAARHLSSAQAAMAAGVTAIHQETVLFDELRWPKTSSRPRAAHRFGPSTGANEKSREARTCMRGSKYRLPTRG